MVEVNTAEALSAYEQEGYVGHDNQMSLPVLKHKHHHLPYFENLLTATNLFGQAYLPLIKTMWYRFVGWRFLKQKFQWRNITIDSRINSLDVLPSGRGKRNKKSVSRKLAKALDLRYENPTTTHPDQLIGKVVTVRERIKNPETNKFRNVERKVPNPGYLSADVFEHDEAHDLMSSRDLNISQSRSHICVGADLYGENPIIKKLVDDIDARVEYFPHGTIGLYSQDLSYPQEVITKGFLRRFVVGYLTEPIDRTSIYHARIAPASQKSDEELIKYSEYLRKINGEFWVDVDEKAAERLIELSSRLTDYAALFGTKARKYGNTLEQPLIERLLQFSVLLALGNGHRMVTVHHIELAFADLLEILTGSYQFCEDCVSGAFIVPGVEPRLAGTLVWLYNQEGKTTISDFKNRIASELSVSFRQAERHYATLKKLGWIDGEQEGQHDSKVWLVKELPPEITSGTSGTTGTTLREISLGTNNDYYSSILNLIDCNSCIKPSKTQVSNMSFLTTLTTLKDYIASHQNECGVTVEDLDFFWKGEGSVDAALKKLQSQGDVFEPRPGLWRCIR